MVDCDWLTSCDYMYFEIISLQMYIEKFQSLIHYLVSLVDVVNLIFFLFLIF